MQWTAGQRAAIDARNESVLVSAAAGSGKTAVLVERVLSLLREGGQIDRLLIVTFTRAAAGEMRERIGRRLEEEGAQNAHLRRQALRLNRAAICTLHVFCARVLKEHFQAAGVDPMARIADEERLSALRAADALFRGELMRSSAAKRLWQYFAVLSPMPGSGGDLVVCLRAVHASERTQAYAARLPYDLMENVVDRILRTQKQVSRVVYDLTPSGNYAGIDWQ